MQKITHRKLKAHQALCGAYETMIGRAVLYGRVIFCKPSETPSCRYCAQQAPVNMASADKLNKKPS